MLAVLMLPPSAGADPSPPPGIVGTTELMASDARSGKGVGGYDPVSYHLDPEPRSGLARYELTFGGLAFRFASKANRAAFRRDPAAFLPRIGGYDAAAAASGRLSSADPLIYAVRDGRLYLFRTPEGRRRFLADKAAPAAAEAAWARIRTGLVRG